MLYLLDTANVKEIEKAAEVFPLAGVTTNPSIIAQEKRNFFSILKWAANTFTKTMDVENVGQGLHAIAMSPYSNQLAVSWVNAGVYQTKIYRRLGSFYQEIQTVNGFGQLIDFSADGTMILDCGSKKALKRNGLTGVFEANDAIVANVATGVVRQALSDHVQVPFPRR